jgi:ABC-type sugar transport system permease subunit
MPPVSDHPTKETSGEGRRAEAELVLGLRPRPFLTAVWRAPQREWFGYVLALPVLLLIGVVVLYPVFQGIILSFTNASLLTPARAWVGLENYRQLLADANFSNALIHSVILTTVAVSLELLIGMQLALLLGQKVPGIRVFRSLTMASWVLPIVSTVLMFELMVLPRNGLFNIILDRLGIHQWDSYWFGNLTLAFPLIILMHVWRNAPFFGIALFASMQTIPRDYYEAAAIDGASALQRFRHITLPGVAYVAMIMVILHVLFTFTNFDFVYLSTGGGPINTSMVLPVYVYELFWQNYQTGLAAACGVLIMLMLLVFSTLYVVQVREREV